MSSERNDLLFELEQRLAQAGRRLPAEEASFLIAEDFVEFGSSEKVWSKVEIIAAMSQWSPIERIVENFRVRELSPSVCLVTYKVLGVDRQSSPFSLRSSIWRNNRENIFAIEVHHLLAEEEVVVALATVKAERNGRSAAFPEVHVWRLANKKITEFREFQGDEQTEDRFWS
jgi:hypothetical protein